MLFRSGVKFQGSIHFLLWSTLQCEVRDHSRRLKRPPCVRPSRWLPYASMYVQMCMSSCAHAFIHGHDGLTDWLVTFDCLISLVLCCLLSSTGKALQRKPDEKSLPACPLADMAHAHSCLNPKAQPASPPHAEARPLGASQRLGHAVPLGALRRAAGAAQEAQASPGAQPPDDAADVDDETVRPAGELPGFPVVFTTHRACDPHTKSVRNLRISQKLDPSASPKSENGPRKEIMTIIGRRSTHSSLCRGTKARQP